MSDEFETNPNIDHDAAVVGDDRAPLALALGFVTALAAGGAWALLVFVTNMEIGYAAWGIGLVVGLAMSRVTRQRTQSIAVAAAVLALLGLVAGKAFIVVGSAGAIAKEVVQDGEAMKATLAWQLYDARTLNQPTLAEVDNVRAAGDTLSDAVWADMLQQASLKLDAMSPEEQQAAARIFAKSYVQAVGIGPGIVAQLSLFDLLWVFLAVGTAYRMLAPPKELDAV